MARPADTGLIQTVPNLEIFRPPPDQAVLALRTAARLLLLTRHVLRALAGGADHAARVAVSRVFLSQVRALLGDLRALQFSDDVRVAAALRRVLQRFQQIKTIIHAATEEGATILLLEVELLMLSGKPEDAYAAITPLMHAVVRLQGRDLRDEIASRYLSISMAEGRSQPGFVDFVEYLSRRRPHGRIGLRFARELQLIAGHTAILHTAGLHHTARVIRYWHRLRQVRPQRIAATAADISFERVAPSVIRHELRSSAPAAGVVRVVRSMGGIGDLLMMTPGLRALSKRTGQPIPFGVPARYLGLFAGNPYVSALAVESLPASWFRAGPVVDLSDCPAAMIESRSAPAVTVNRIEIFARAMGVSNRELRSHGLRPYFEPTPDGKQRAEEWLRCHGLWEHPFVAVQSASSEPYRTWNRMTEAARTIADTMPVVVFDDRPSAESGMTNVRARNVTLATGLDLSTSLALACHASVILAPDSAFTHLAGARNIPCVSVFGPTDGALRMSAYPRAIVVSRGKDLPCVPCWRNQSMPCMLTGGMASQCLEALPVSAVVDAVSHQIREYRLIGPVT